MLFSPAATALIDQTQAAVDHAFTALTSGAAREGLPTRYVKPTGNCAVSAILGRLLELWVTGKLTPCPHLDLRAPQPQYWCAWRPGRMRCAPCGEQAALAIKGTKEDSRCDNCKRIVRVINSCITILPGVVAPELLIASGPTIVNFGLCARCNETIKYRDSDLS